MPSDYSLASNRFPTNNSSSFSWPIASQEHSWVRHTLALVLEAANENPDGKFSGKSEKNLDFRKTPPEALFFTTI